MCDHKMQRESPGAIKPLKFVIPTPSIALANDEPHGLNGVGTGGTSASNIAFCLRSIDPDRSGKPIR